MTKKQKPDRLVVEPKDKGLAVFSYDGIGLALRIGDNDMDTVFEVAKKAIKKQQEKSTDFDDESPKEKTDDRQEERQEVRIENKKRKRSSAKSVAGDTSTGGVSSEVHGPEKSDVR